MTVALLLALILAPGGADPTQRIGLLEAIELVRAKELDVALDKLKHLCPLPQKELSKAADRGNVACQLRIFAWTEDDSPTDPKEISRIYWLAGDEAYKRGELELSEALLKVAIERDSEDAYNWYSIGLVYRDGGRPAEAVIAFEQSLEINPREPYTLYWLASALMDLGQLDQAEDTLDTVLQIDPSHARVWFRRGEIHMTRGEYERAIQAFKTAKKRGVRKKHVVAKIRECEQRLNEQ